MTKNLQEALLMMFTLLHLFEIFLAFIPRDWKQVKQVDCNTCLSHVICMLFLAVIISTVLHSVLKQGPIMIETNVIFHVFMCVTQSVFMPILYLSLLPFYFLLSCNHILPVKPCFFFLLKKNKFKIHLVTLFTHMKCSYPCQALFFFF